MVVVEKEVGRHVKSKSSIGLLFCIELALMNSSKDLVVAALAEMVHSSVLEWR